MRYGVFPLMLGMLLFCGCPKKQTIQEPPKEPLTETAVPASQSGAAPAPFPEQPAASNPAPAQPPAAQPARPMSGWRVQLFASGTRENARRVAEEARWKFPDQQIFIIEQEGLHKVQVGNGLGRAQADQLKQRAKEQGYLGAFAVEVAVGP